MKGYHQRLYGLTADMGSCQLYVFMFL
uniref:Uncharacterized protein n=1 Tax=Anguilla anguilla TaxID=7936 RepID=A0A0E9RL88_ANGAN